MKVFEVMTIEVEFCRLEDNLMNAAQIMWQKDCGVVPVVDAGQHVVGVITDRDICIAAATCNQKTSQIKTGEMNFRPPIVCAMEDDVKDVLRRMRKYKVKRLCVTNKDKELLGIISLTDILLKAGEKKSVQKLIFSTLKAIAKPAPIVLREQGETTAEQKQV
ncbi:MAG: CBS domain-containing protein [Actinomycetota bacterium]